MKVKLEASPRMYNQSLESSKIGYKPFDNNIYIRQCPKGKHGKLVKFLTDKEIEELEKRRPDLEKGWLSFFKKEDNFWLGAKGFKATVVGADHELDLDDLEDYITYKLLLFTGDAAYKDTEDEVAKRNALFFIEKDLTKRKSSNEIIKAFTELSNRKNKYTNKALLIGFILTTTKLTENSIVEGDSIEELKNLWDSYMFSFGDTLQANKVDYATGVAAKENFNIDVLIEAGEFFGVILKTKAAKQNRLKIEGIDETFRNKENLKAYLTEHKNDEAVKNFIATVKKQ